MRQNRYFICLIYSAIILALVVTSHSGIIANWYAAVSGLYAILVCMCEIKYKNLLLYAHIGNIVSGSIIAIVVNTHPMAYLWFSIILGIAMVTDKKERFYNPLNKKRDIICFVSVFIIFLALGEIVTLSNVNNTESQESIDKLVNEEKNVLSTPEPTVEPTEKPTEKPTEIPTEIPTVEPKPELTEDEYKALCTTYKYKDVLRNPENFVGQKVKVEVRISSVHEASMFNHTKYYFAYSKSKYGWSGDSYGIMDKRADNSFKILSDDIVYVYGEIANPEYTKSLFLNSEEIFVIDMKYVELISE